MAIKRRVGAPSTGVKRNGGVTGTLRAILRAFGEQVKQFWIYALVALVVGGIVYAAPWTSRQDDGPPGFDDLEPCTELTSLDGQKSLRLSRDHKAAFSDSSGLAVRTQSGTWSLVDDDRHIYRVTLDSAAQDYILASAPAGEGCMLVAGRLDAADLGKSWFSALTDSD